MKLWILRPINDAAAPWEPWWDKAFGFVVRAESEAAARLLVSTSDHCGDEGAGSWLDGKLSVCDELTADGAAAVVMKDFASA